MCFYFALIIAMLYTGGFVAMVALIGVWPTIVAVLGLGIIVLLSDRSDCECEKSVVIVKDSDGF